MGFYTLISIENEGGIMKKKNIIALILFVFFLVNIIAIIIPVFVRAEDNIKVKYNNKIIKSDVAPIIHNDRVLVPVRMIFEAIEADIEWNAKTRVVTIINGEDTIKFTIDSDIAYVNKTKHKLDTVAKIISDRTFVPLRFIAENSGLQVDWSDKERTVYLKDKEDEEKEEVKKNYLLDISVKDDEITLTFKNEDITFNSFSLSEPLRLVVDIDNCIRDTKKEPEIDSDFYKTLRYAQFSNDPIVVRLVAELNEKVEYDFKVKDNKLTVKFYEKGEKPSDDEDEEDIEDEEIIYKEPVYNKKYPTVVLDPGHGGSDPGALGEVDGEIILKEKDVNLKIALKVYKILKEEKINVYMTRGKDVYLSLLERCEYANKKNADLFVSVHNNATENPETSGTMVMYAYDTKKEGYDISGEEFAKIMQKHLVKATDAKDFGPRKNASLYVVKNTTMPAVITESLFITNEEDREKLMDNKYINDIAKAIANGIIEVLDI